MIRKRVVVEGRVQNVGFRASCTQRARTAGVSGTVRNLADGRVEAVFEGPATAVDALVAWCGHGPPMAHVDRVAVIEEAPLGETAFHVT